MLHLKILAININNINQDGNKKGDRIKTRPPGEEEVPGGFEPPYTVLQTAD